MKITNMQTPYLCDMPLLWLRGADHGCIGIVLVNQLWPLHCDTYDYISLTHIFYLRFLVVSHIVTFQILKSHVSFTYIIIIERDIALLAIS